ncbi:MAG: phosphonopyruvate decarboxylase [Elusimicrobia bacterium RIFOXYA12_FULL_51_18]|nr:MAG: phosphonopyruvate decarboxylase [Elusimicrobia bacterium RIFOXYA12_FULL_51_18]OGS28487.1 MAG: phosphonopyruvate decarboxylase [Elusimicrobia bacterium RIFOXYA2_FULL_53_38]
MLACSDFFNALTDAGFRSYAGVPDSLLKNFCAYVTDHVPETSHCITANEGAAVALEAGRYLATGDIGVVYLQNSGLGNAVNPITSLLDPEVYSIPVLFLIGWRGEPGVKDEPQHVKQGKNMIAILDALDVPYRILPVDIESARMVIQEAKISIKKNLRSYALIVKKDTFDSYKLKNVPQPASDLKREEAIELVLKNIEEQAIVVSTTGMISREVFEYRTRTKAEHNRDFLTVGSMGHASQIALGIALSCKSRPVYCLDGDGALLMHMGSAAILASMAPKNMTHIVLNNGAHDSVGGQPTIALQINLIQFAQSLGYTVVSRASIPEEVEVWLKSNSNVDGPKFLEIRVAPGARIDLGRPTVMPKDNKVAFMNYCKQSTKL